MNQRLIFSITLAAMLAACSAKPVKDEPPPPVVDKSTAKTQTAPKASTQQSASSAETSSMKDSSMKVDPLNDPSNILYKRSVYFDYDKDDVKAEFRPLVEAHAKYLTQHPDAHVMLQGNADDRGSREYNLALGQRRSASVKKVMNVYGASDNQIETVSYGEEKPRCTEQSESCWSQNRRVDIVYTGK